MTDRTVKVSVVAQVSGFVSGFTEANQAARRLNDTTQKLADQRAAMQTVGASLLGVGTLLAAGVGIAVAKFVEFDKQMSSVQAATHETASNMGLLRDAAVQAGADTVFSATEAAQAEEELAKAGVSTAAILSGGLKGALDLAAAGDLAVADAAATAATAMTQFKLEGSDVPHVADLLAAGAGKAQGSVQDLSQALNQGGLVASQAGQSIEGTTGVLAAFASAGLIGSDAGTSLKTMLLSLEAPSTKAQKVMDTYGISVYDANGKMLDFSGIAGQLQTRLANLSQEQRNSALATIFGTDAVRAASVLYDQGASGIQQWTNKVNDQGYAAETARLKLNNLAGDFEYLSGSIDSVFITSGSAANDVLRGLVQGANALVDAFGAAPTPIQQTALVLAAVGAAAALAGGAFLLGVPQIASFASALATLGASEIPLVASSAARMTSAIATSGAVLKSTAAFLTGPWGLALAAASAGVVILSQQLNNLQASSEQLTNSLVTAKTAQDVFAVAGQGKDIKWVHDVNGDLKDLQNVLNAADDQAKNVFTRFDSTHFGAFDALKSIGKELGSLAASDLPKAQHAFSLLVAETDGSQRSIQLLLDQMPDYRNALTTQATKLGESADATALLKLAQEGAAPVSQAATDAVKAQAAATEAQTKALEDWMKMVSDSDAGFIDLKGAWDSVIQKNKDWAQSQADATESTKDSWKDFYDGFSVTKDQYLADLQAQVDAQNNWEQNMILLSGKVSQSTLDELAKLGPEGAPLVAQLVDASGDELSRLDGLVQEKTSQATGTFANTLNGAGPIISAAAAQLGQGAANEIAQKLASGTVTVEQIMQQYKLKVEGYVPVIDVNTATAYDKIMSLQAQIRAATADYNFRIATGPGGQGGQTVNENGNMYLSGHAMAFANGGFPTGIYAAQPLAIHKFAEPNVGWEAYISGKPGMEKRNAGIALETLTKLGYAMPGGGRYGQYAGSSSTVVSLAGAQVVIDIGGQQFTGVVRDQIVNSSQLIFDGQRGLARAGR